MANICEITIGGLQVQDPLVPDDDVNWFVSTTGAGRYGHGQFLMRLSDYDTVSTAAANGLSTLVMTDHRGTAAGTLTIPVFVLSASPYLSNKGDESGDDVVLVKVADKRMDKSTASSAAINVQTTDFSYDGADPDFIEGTLNSSAEYTWAEAASELEVPSIPSAPTSWKPRNLIVDHWHYHRIVDWVASSLFLVVGWDDATSAFTYHVPGVMTEANTARMTASDFLLTEGRSGKRNVKRLPSSFRVYFRGRNADDATDPFSQRSYIKDVAVSGGASAQPLHEGSYIATYSGGAFKETAAMDAVAADLAARAYAFISVQSGTYSYNGIIPFVPDGAIREVMWKSNPNGPRTSISMGCQFDWGNSANGGIWSYCDHGILGTRRLELPSDQLMIGVGGTSSSVSVNGSRYMWSEPSSSKKFGKVVSYTPGSNSVELDPCDIGGTDNGIANITAKIEWPLSKTTCSFFGGSVDEVLMYDSEDGNYWLIGNHPKPSTITDAHVYQSTDASGQGGFGYVRKV